MRRRIDLQRFPAEKTCLKFEIATVEGGVAHYWIVDNDEGLELCITDPGFPVDLYVTTDVRTLTLVSNGDLSLRAMIEDGRIDLHGPTRLVQAFPSWLQLNMFAGVPAAG
ncbi:MAG: SCP2 sterol-binding domain-containing protein, partial [Thalassovita sp.]|nr:SCP2 sterol-binding domain-containing protein [Thalassovita sp.]